MAVFSVADDGIGMDELALGTNPAIGLSGMRERAALCCGTLTFEPNPPHGTQVMVRLPVASPSLPGRLDP